MTRNRSILQLDSRKVPWDVIVIGGGASGLGVAVDSASRGYHTVLLEAHDFAKGTSSRSTKLIHGGVRYLAQGRLSLVRQALRERAILARNAVHLVHGTRFIIPTYRWWEKPLYLLGLWIYDLMAGKNRIGRTRSIDREEAMQGLGNISDKELRGGIAYFDAQFDDARLAIDLARTAVDHGACVIGHMPVTALLKDPLGKVNGVVAMDDHSGSTRMVHGKCIINATGVFTNSVLGLDGPGINERIVPSQGIHIVLDRSFLPGGSAMMIPRTPDGRVLFAIPWHDHVVLGTTDTPVDHVTWEPIPSEAEIDLLLKSTEGYLSRVPERKDILSIYAGLRPLIAKGRTGEDTKELSRKHEIHVSGSSLISMLGGKWTTYRAMAEDTIDEAIARHLLPPLPCRTTDLSIHGNTNGMKLDRSDPLHIYGSAIAEIHKIQDEDSGTMEQLHPDHPFTLAQVVHAVRNEMAMTVEDVLARRVRLLFIDAKAAMVAAPRVARILAREGGHDDHWIVDQIAAFHAIASQYLIRSEDIAMNAPDGNGTIASR